ncbi:MAG: DegV family protein, partial [Lachnospiraceae bacterium]|nr:DegV family protein [Lachnospiraceae bacterium]
MKSVGVVTDSNSGITPEMGENIGVMVLPMPFFIDGECFYENVTISREEFFDK